jgi:hypothetical protein
LSCRGNIAPCWGLVPPLSCLVPAAGAVKALLPAGVDMIVQAQEQLIRSCGWGPSPRTPPLRATVPRPGCTNPARHRFGRSARGSWRSARSPGCSACAFHRTSTGESAESAERGRAGGLSSACCATGPNGLKAHRSVDSGSAPRTGPPRAPDQCARPTEPNERPVAPHAQADGARRFGELQPEVDRQRVERVFRRCALLQ